MRFAERVIRALSRLPLVRRRRLLRLVWRLSVFGPRTMGAADLLARTLRLSRGEAARLDREMHFHDFLQEMEWFAAGTKPLAAIESDEAGIRVEDEALFARLAASPEPVILAPFHMGTYPLGLACLMRRFFRGRPLLVLRGRDDMAVEDGAMRRLAAYASELRLVNAHHKNELLEAVRFARGGAVVVCFADLPARYGAPAAVKLFGEPAEIALGLDALSRLMRACVVPVAVRSRVDGDTVCAGRPFEAFGSGAGERAGVAALLARQLELFVHQNPAQWHMWPRLAEFRPGLREDGVEAHGVA